MTELCPFPVEQELEIRRQLRQAVGAVVPPEHVELVVDLTVHAVQSALRTLERVCDGTGNPNHLIAALSPASGLLAGRCEMLGGALEAYAAKCGMPAARSAVQLGGGG